MSSRLHGQADVVSSDTTVCKVPLRGNHLTVATRKRTWSASTDSEGLSLGAHPAV